MSDFVYNDHKDFLAIIEHMFYNFLTCGAKVKELAMTALEKFEKIIRELSDKDFNDLYHLLISADFPCDSKQNPVPLRKDARK